MRGFKEFLLRGNVLELAVAVVIGVAFTAMINALVKDLITPLIAALGGKPDFSALTFTINGSRFLYGDFINYVIAFLIIAAVVYLLIVLPLNWATSLRKKEEEATMRKCPECLSEIPKAAHRCAFCAASVLPIEPYST
jgi:large conductance mechanosensitive channel